MVDFAPGTKFPTKPVTHLGINCDNCHTNPIQGPRYKCINCEDFDVCSICEQLEVHDLNHVFLKINRPTQNSAFPFIPVPVSQFRATAPVGSKFEFQSTKPSGILKYLSLIQALRKFSLQLQSQVFDGEPSAVCGLNIYQCLMMAVQGARAATLEGMAQALGASVQELSKGVEVLCKIDAYCKSGGQAEMTTAVSVWYRHGFILKDEYVAILRHPFNASFGPISAPNINNFINASTKGKVQGTLSEKDIGRLQLALVSCLYFKALWRKPFQKSSTYSSSFHGPGLGTRVACQMMKIDDTFKFHEDSRSWWIFLDYKFQGTEMNDKAKPEWTAAFVLPKSSGTFQLEAILKDWAKDSKSFISPGSATDRRVVLHIPRFRIIKGVPMKPHLINMGFKAIFDPSADFTGMSANPMCVDEVAHQVVIEVNEEGTEVAAATTLGMTFGAPPPAFLFNRPFIFVVFDRNSGIILCSAVPGIGKGCEFI